MKHYQISILFCVICLATPAYASTLVLGNGLGAACYSEAKYGRSDKNALDTCNLALDNVGPSRSQTAATYVNRGIVRSNRGDFDGALSDYGRALKINPDLAEAFANRGNVYIRTRQFDQALSELDRALSLDLAQPASVYYNRAVVYEHFGDMAKAYYDYQKAAELRPNWSLPQQELKRFSVQSD